MRAYRNRRRKKPIVLIWILMIAVILLTGAFCLRYLSGLWKLEKLTYIETPDWIQVQLLSQEDTARNGTKLSGIKDIVIHYVGNPGTTAQQNRDFFNTKGTKVSSHFVVGLEGEIIQCLPLEEKSAASNHRNKDTISIEVCHPDETGKFNDKTYAALVKLTAWLCRECGLKPNCVIRHYDVTGKECPLYYVHNPQAWDTFKQDVADFTF